MVDYADTLIAELHRPPGFDGLQQAQAQIAAVRSDFHKFVLSNQRGKVA